MTKKVKVTFEVNVSNNFESHCDIVDENNPENNKYNVVKWDSFVQLCQRASGNLSDNDSLPYNIEIEQKVNK